MIRAKALYSVLLVSFAISACDKSRPSHPPTAKAPATPQPFGMPPGGRAMDPTLMNGGAQGNPLGTTGTETVRSAQVQPNQAQPLSGSLSSDGSSQGRLTKTYNPGTQPESDADLEGEAAPQQAPEPVYTPQPSSPPPAAPSVSTSSNSASNLIDNSDSSSGSNTIVTTVAAPSAPVASAAPAPDQQQSAVIPAAPIMNIPPVHQSSSTTVNPMATGTRDADKAFYTDSKLDSLSETLWADYKSKPEILSASRLLAHSITKVRFANSKGTFKLLLDLYEEQGKPVVIAFEGSRDFSEIAKAQDMRGKMHAKGQSRTFSLKAKSDDTQKLAYIYNAVVTCDDKDYETCENAIIQVGRFDLNPKAGEDSKPLALVPIIFRQGPATVTFTEDAQSKNRNQRFLALFLKNSALKACTTCTDNVNLPNGADRTLLRSWSVIDGDSKFDLIFASKDDNAVFKSAFMISGALVSINDPSKPELLDKRDKSTADRSKWIKSAVLTANDGAGHLNIDVNLSEDQNQPAATMHVSVASNFAPTRQVVAGKNRAPKAAPAATADASSSATPTTPQANSTTGASSVQATSAVVPSVDNSKAAPDETPAAP